MWPHRGQSEPPQSNLILQWRDWQTAAIHFNAKIVRPGGGYILLLPPCENGWVTAPYTEKRNNLRSYVYGDAVPASQR